jgi:hypothetical protein
MEASVGRSYRAGLVLFGYLILVKVVLLAASAASPGFRSPSQAGVFAWWFLGALLVAGAGSIWLNHWVGLPPLWDSAIPLRDRLHSPILLGVLLGLVSIAIDVATGWTKLSAAKMGIPSIHIPWPNSLLIYPGGAIIVDVLYYLIPIPLLLGGLKLIGRWSGPPPAAAFWTVGALAAAIEPVTQMSTVPGHPLARFVEFGQDYLLNLVQVWSYRRAGWVSAVVLRVAFYLVWHVLWGLFG